MTTRAKSEFRHGLLAKMALCAYMRYQQMGLLILDPQGEFAKDFRGGGSGEMRIPLAGIAKQFNKQVVTLSVRNLVLDRWELFQEILFESDFFQQLTMPKGDNRRDVSVHGGTVRRPQKTTE